MEGGEEGAGSTQAGCRVERECIMGACHEAECGVDCLGRGDWDLEEGDCIGAHGNELI